MTTPTNEPEETATPFCDANCGVVWDANEEHPQSFDKDSNGGFMLKSHAQKLELRALSAERERDELREAIEKSLGSAVSRAVVDVQYFRDLLSRTKPAQ